MNESIFKLYANCIPVKGARRSLLCDLQNQKAHFIPNDLYHILTAFAGRPASEIKDNFDADCASTIDEYFSFLVEHEFGFWCDEPDAFPPLELSWDRPEVVTNAIIDVDTTSCHDYYSLFQQLSDMGCEAVQLRIYAPLSLGEVTRIVEICETGYFRHLDIFLAHNPTLTEEDLRTLCFEHQIISRVIIHSSPEESHTVLDPLPIVISFTRQSITPESCGCVHQEYFVVNVEHFVEAQHFNTCLNRKIGIAANGDIKSCPSMWNSCGNAQSTPLINIVGTPEWRQLARITKDDIDVCRDCEFRYICTDCRAWLEGDLYSKPAKCSYDPYTATWRSPVDANVH